MPRCACHLGVLLNDCIAKNKFGIQCETMYLWFINNYYMQNDEALRLRISKETKDQLQRLADKENRKLSDYIRLALIKMVEKEMKK